MKNREKYRDEIVKTIRNGRTCNFVQEKVLPCYWGDRGADLCEANSCEYCTKMFAFWLDEEYEEPEEPEVDWYHVPVDTLVRVRDREDQEWTLMYFKGIDENDPEFRFLAWDDGATSITAYGNYTHWRYCELVEDDEDGSN